LFPGGRAVELLRYGEEGSLVFEVGRPGEREMMLAVWALIGPEVPREFDMVSPVQFAETRDAMCLDLDWAEPGEDELVEETGNPL
jgi:hypothetical protein